MEVYFIILGERLMQITKLPPSKGTPMIGNDKYFDSTP